MKKGWFFAVMILSLVALGGCGKTNTEKIEQAQSAYLKLVERHNEVVDAYAQIDDESLGKQLDEMAEKINVIGEKEIKNLSEEEIDGMIKELEENIASYDEVLTAIQTLGEKETQKEMKSLPITIKNNTGITFVSLFLYPADSEDKGKNLVEEMELMDGYATLSIADFYLTDDAKSWMLMTIDREGNTIIQEEVDLLAYAGKGLTIQMDYNFDSNEGWLEIS